MKSDIIARAHVAIHATVTKVWEALTNPATIKKYFFNTNASTTWEPGTPITFTGEWQGKQYEDKGTVLDVQKPRMIRYNYRSSMSGIEDKPGNYVVITYEITGNDNDIILTVTQQNVPNEVTKNHSEENWNKVLGNLKTLLEEG